MAGKTSLKHALLVIDMQEHFRSFGASIVPQLNRTIQHCRSKQVPVIFTQHGHRHLDFDGGVLADHWGAENSIHYGSEAWKLMPELTCDKSKEIIIYEKRRYDAFYGTILLDILRQMNVDTVVISGVMTNLCCETTARSAFVRDFNVIFLSDGTATTSQEMHDATLLNIDFGFGKVMNCTEYQKAYC